MTRTSRIRPVFRSAEQFRAEWQQACGALPERWERILSGVVTERRSRASIAREAGVTRERIRQLVQKALENVRHWAELRPDSELRRAAQRLAEAAETAGVEVWMFHRLGPASQQEIVARMIRCGAIALEEADLMPAACGLVRRPAGARPSLDGVTRRIQRMLAERPGGMTPDEIRAGLGRERDAINLWPSLDLATFVAATASPTVKAKGRLRLPAKRLTRTQNQAELMVRALRAADRCLTIPELERRTEELSRREGVAIQHHDRSCAAIAMEDERFRWVARGTYGLAEWNVGHSRPDLKTGRKLSIRDELVHLMEDRAEMPMADLMAHFERRFRVKPKTVRVAIHSTPGLSVRKDALVRTARIPEARPPQDKRSERPTRRTMEPSALRDAREAQGLTRKELAGRCGTSYGVIRRYEAGTQSPQPGRLRQLAEALGVSPESLRQRDRTGE